ncbi:hypothetical protein GOP47_0015991 [Adiantum capillus-veneris]|uniref:Uncharacterized protein n=1 Tax=Adiantum capillus-veneris TaxID=13818 RepID=A0A9D4UKQ9_ADICA|nr:hypothetical protein GOP47_0015991 [Adiantum capillus-veneris]
MVASQIPLFASPEIWRAALGSTSRFFRTEASSAGWWVVLLPGRGRRYESGSQRPSAPQRASTGSSCLAKGVLSLFFFYSRGNAFSGCQNSSPNPVFYVL